MSEPFAPWGRYHAMTDMDYADRLYEAAFAMFSAAVTADKEVPPLVLVMREDGQIGAFSRAWMSPDEAQRLFFRAADNPGCLAAAFACEGWAVKRDKLDADELARLQDEGLGDAPDRIEVVSITVLCGARQAFATCEIDRDRRTLARPPLCWCDEPGGEATGPLVRPVPTQH